MEYGFLVERSKIEKASFLYKTALSEANVKANRMVTTKCTNYKLQYYRERSFASNYFIFLKVLFQVKNLFINDWFNVPTTQTSIFVLFLSSWILSKYPDSTKPSLPCLENFLIAHLHSGIILCAERSILNVCRSSEYVFFSITAQ